MYHDEEKLLKMVRSIVFYLIIMLFGSILGWEPAILMILTLIYLKET